MADAKLALAWLGEGLQFRGGPVGGAQVTVDGDSKAGISPVQALLLSLAGCMGADVADILQKGRVPFSGLNVQIEGDRVSDPPRRFRAIRLTFVLHGLAPDAGDKLHRAIELSREKYCSVLHTLRSDIDFHTAVELPGQGVKGSGGQGEKPHHDVEFS